MKYLFIGLCLFFLSCSDQMKDETQLVESEYSFFAAGHTYGHNVTFQEGFHPPFKNAIPQINNVSNLEFGVLTGDIVPQATPLYFDAVIEDLSLFSHPIHIAAGNHDRGALFEETFGDYFYSFKQNDDLFIILSPTDWNIEGEQKTFLEETINNNSASVNNIFIFMHELIWWSPDNIFKNVKINYVGHYPGTTNYWSEIEPLFKNIENNIVLIAGDLGTNQTVDSYMYYKEENITYIASGMGGGAEDNIIIVDVDSEGNPSYNLMGINSDSLKILADLESYILP